MPAPDPEAQLPAMDSGQAALSALRAFREAMAVGDLSLALSLVDREASLVDALAGDPEAFATRGEVLLELRARLAEGMRIREDSTRISLPNGVAVVESRLSIEVEEDAPDRVHALSGRSVHEIVVLVPTPDGWRIRHLHRSVLPGPGVPD
jgi:hypothetical protein